jgi:hypothetical protein
MDLDKKRIEQPVEPIRRYDEVWLWCPTTKTCAGHWQNTTGARRVNVFPPPFGSLSRRWDVVPLRAMGSITHGFVGADAEARAFEQAAKLLG